MNLTIDIKDYMSRSVLCWLATVSDDNIPNVSPKEIFDYYADDKIIIANIASPQTVRNIIQNENVCVSFIDILVQKGYQLKGKARILQKTDFGYLEMENSLIEMTGGNYPFATITEITVEQSKPIIAPKNVLYTETTEAEQIESARIIYGIQGSFEKGKML